MQRKRILGTIASALLALLAIPGYRDDLETWMGWMQDASRWASENPGELVGTVLILAAIAVGLWSWDVPQRVIAKLTAERAGELPQDGKSGHAGELTDISRKKFQNEKVPLDGHRYQNCEFENVSLVYGGKPFEMHNNTFR